MKVAVAKHVGVVEQDGVVYVAALPDGPILVLSDAAADSWRAVSSRGEGGPPVDLEDDGYIEALLAAGLLTTKKDS